MPCRYGSRPDQRLRIEFVEADFEIGFNLVDIAEGESIQAHHAAAERALTDAEDVFSDIKHRLEILGVSESIPFQPLVGELRRAIDLAKTHNS